MASLSKRLASPWLAFVLLAGLAAWLSIGVVLAQAGPTAKLMRALNQGRHLDWLRGPAFSDPLLVGWLLGLAALSGLLLLNLIYCILTWLAGKSANLNRHRRLLVLVHLLLAVVIVGHGASFLLGYKNDGVRLLAGQEIILPDGHRVKLLQVHFSADRALLDLDYRQARQAMTRVAFSRRDNWALVELTAANGQRESGRVWHFEPLVNGTVSAHMVGFFNIGGGPSPSEVGAVFNLTRNPLAVVFFAAYGLLMLCMAVLLW